MQTLHKHHIDVQKGQSPVDVRLTERPFKAYLVANLAFIESPKHAADQYELSLGAVYSAMAFYEDNRESIEKAISEARSIDFGDAEVSQDGIEDVRRRLDEIENT